MVAPGSPATKSLYIQEHNGKTVQLISNPEISKGDVEEGSQHNPTLRIEYPLLTSCKPMDIN